MIIGSNNKSNLSNQNFINRMNDINQNSMNHTPISNPQPVNPMLHSNILSKKEMHEKTFEMLQSRYQNGLISLDEFNRKCKELGKRQF